jgi:hypothetical protein
MNAYVILTTNGDDTFMTIVNQKTWDWFQKRINDPHLVTEDPPEAQIVGCMEANECTRLEALSYLKGNPDSRSHDNDIALMLVGDEFNGEHFTEGSLPALFAFLSQRGITLADQYIGMVY